MDERPLAISALGNLKKKYRLGRVRKPGEAPKGDPLAALSTALQEVSSAIESDDTDDVYAEAEGVEEPKKESVLQSFTFSGPKKPGAPMSGPPAAPKPRGRPRKVK